MRLKRYGLTALQKLAKFYGFTLTPTSRILEAKSSLDLDENSRGYLHPDNPRLQELQSQYSGFSSAATIPTVWTTDIINASELQYFRGENAYVWQSRAGNSGINYALSYYYLRAHNALDLLDKLSEDYAFGVLAYDIDNRIISRDLLDSILEISFLERSIGLSKIPEFKVLDIGAGYGRLAHRMATAMPNLGAYYCTDAVPYSTFLSEFYLRYRNIENKAHVVPLLELDNLRNKSIDIAVNIHSFSECSLSAIEWWCKYIASLGIRYFMIAPNPGKHGGNRLSTTPGDHDFNSIINAAGYRLMKIEPKFLDPSVQMGGIFPTKYHLFQLSDYDQAQGKS